jgi:hypothetical protein
MNIKAFLGLTYYTSELDIFLKEYNKNHPKLSASQRQEVEKYRKIFEMRDGKTVEQPSDMWDKF